MTPSRRLVLVSILSYAASFWFSIGVSPAAPAQIAGAPLVYVRSGPGPAHSPVGILAAGDTVNTLEKVGAWTKVEVPNGQTGYIYSSYIAGDMAVAAPTPGAAAPVVLTPAVGEPIPEALAEPTVAVTPLANEIADLRAEIADLKKQVTVGNATPAIPGVGETVAPGAGAASASPVGLPPADDPNVRTLAVALVSLLLGWVLGATFTRRRSKSQRNRLRF